MNAKKIVVIGLLIGLTFAITFIVAGYHGVEHIARSLSYDKLDPATAHPVSQSVRQPKTSALKTIPAVKSPAVIVATAKSAAQLNTAPSTVTSNGTVDQPSATIQDPAARLALSLVGADPEAEEYWVAAINDPTLGPDERKELIEDLNEDGLSDPKHPGPEDVPLIVNRLQLIDELAPYAMDKVNADAFEEARKDLINLLDGKPVR